MRSHNSPSLEAAQTELQRLYVKRSAIDRLIQALSRYNRHANATQVVPLLRKSPRPVRRELAAVRSVS